MSQPTTATSRPRFTGLHIPADLLAKAALSKPAPLPAKKPLADCKTAAELRRHCPASLGSYDADSIEGLRLATQDQIDLFDQGEESDIANTRQRRSWAAFASHCGKLTCPR